jgi:hypothetical protein
MDIPLCSHSSAQYSVLSTNIRNYFPFFSSVSHWLHNFPSFSSVMHWFYSTVRIKVSHHNKIKQDRLYCILLYCIVLYLYPSQNVSSLTEPSSGDCITSIFFLICAVGLWVLRPLLTYCTSLG